MKEIIIFIVALLGLFIGVLLAKISPEEMKPGKRYFLILKQVLFYIMIVVSLVIVILQKNHVLSAIVAAVSIAFVVLKRIIVSEEKYEVCYNYTLFSILYVLARMNVVSAVIVLMYGLPEGTLLKKKDVIYSIVSLIVPVIVVVAGKIIL